MPNPFTTKQAASYMDCSEQYVRKLIRGERLPASRHGRSWVIDGDDLDAWVLNEDSASMTIPDHPRHAISRSKVKALSFFSGALGMDIGLERAGIEVLLTCEMDRSCRETITLNRPNVALIGDINSYSADDIRKNAGLSKNEEIDLIVGGPPCQAFSTAGKRQGFNDDRGNVFLTFIELIVKLRPRFAVIENVRGLLSAPLSHRPHELRGPKDPPLTPDEQKGGALNHILAKLRSAGYGISFNLYNSANFGSPQVRERVVIVCCRNGDKAPYLVPTHSENGDFRLPKWKSVRQALAGLDQSGHEVVKFPEKRLKYYRMLKEGQYWRHLPEKLQKQAMGASYYAGGGKTGFYRRIAWDKPSPTLVTHPAMPATDLCHPVENRPLSVQEYKRLQEFPDNWKFAGSIIDQYRQIGNAVPTSLGRAIGELIVALSSGQQVKSFVGFAYSRYSDTNEESWASEFLRQTRDEQRQLALAIG